MATQADWEAKFEEIVAEIGRELFGGGLLKPAQELEARVDAEAMVDEWEMAENREPQGLKAKTTLQRLLIEQHKIAQAILDIRDADLSDDDRDQQMGGDGMYARSSGS